ncbi:prepilin peptidase [Gimesia chilikensis]|uniref:prepilin peptidase n=1 Tax=Gimesia chilikensis TaxID=2605989 RepID=UPI0011EFB2C0|nr:A24 family peptidase [Gimesia chilikensis]KAA0140084.1 prepilin peptidase [Gimesia chilikensis]
MFAVPILVWPVICVLALLLSVAILIEFLTQRIPNWLNLAGVFTGLALIVFDHQWAMHLTGFLVGFGIGIMLMSKGYVSGGFSKLLIAIGTIAGPVVPLITLVVSILLILGTSVYDKVRGRYENTFEVPEELEVQDDDMRRPGAWLVKGSLFLSLTTILGLLLLYQPWK